MRQETNSLNQSKKEKKNWGTKRPETETWHYLAIKILTNHRHSLTSINDDQQQQQQ